MAYAPRRFDTIERVVADQRRAVDDMRTTVMARLADLGAAPDGSRIGDILFAKKTEDTSNSTDSFVDDPELQIIAPNDGDYAVEGQIFLKSTTGAQTPDIYFPRSSGSTVTWNRTSAEGPPAVDQNFVSVTLAAGAVVATFSFMGLATLNGSSSTAFRASLRSDSGHTTTIMAGSWLKLTRVA